MYRDNTVQGKKDRPPPWDPDPFPVMYSLFSMASIFVPSEGRGFLPLARRIHQRNPNSVCTLPNS